MKKIVYNKNWTKEELDYKCKPIELTSLHPNAEKILVETKNSIIQLLRGEDWNFKASIIK